MIATGVAAGLLLLAGCSKSGQVEDKVKDLLEKELKVENAKVDCPGDVKAKKGEEFDCHVTGKLAGQDLDAQAHVVFESDNKFTITAMPPTAGAGAGASDAS